MLRMSSVRRPWSPGHPVYPNLWPTSQIIDIGQSVGTSSPSSPLNRLVRRLVPGQPSSVHGQLTEDRLRRSDRPRSSFTVL